MFSEPISQKGSRRHFDAIVIGAGLAGLSYCLSLVKHKPHVRIALICKKDLQTSNSQWAQGGIASASLTSDSCQQHMQDTLRAGDGLCHESAVQTACYAAQDAIQFLMDQGVQFDRDAKAEFILGREGGHSARRVFHVGDHTGAAVISALLNALGQCESIDIFEQHIAVNLMTQVEPHQPSARHEVIGAYILNKKTGLIDTFLAKTVILATGGAGKVYRYTTNPDVATGCGVAMAYRAGARVGNLEFYQFHPTLLYHPEQHNFLLSEALRGEGAMLRSVSDGERFMQRYAPEQLELATRDVVARAIFNEIECSASNYVHLDLRHLGNDFLKARFPTIYQTLTGLGFALEKDCVPVVPGAHYMCGGVLTDMQGLTDLHRLYAIGEAAFTGLHGANRLACNSLLEAVIMGQKAAAHSQALLTDEVRIHKNIQDWDSKSVIDVRRESQVSAQWRGLRGEMSSYAGIVRTAEGLDVLLKLIMTRREMVETYYWRHVITPDLIELRNICLVAELLVRAALARQETRGGHYREDFPNTLSVGEETILRTQRESRISSERYERPVE